MDKSTQDYLYEIYELLDDIESDTEEKTKKIKDIFDKVPDIESPDHPYPLTKDMLQYLDYDFSKEYSQLRIKVLLAAGLNPNIILLEQPLIVLMFEYDLFEIIDILIKDPRTILTETISKTINDQSVEREIHRKALAAKIEERRQIERTFIMIKPDGYQRGLVGEIISRFEKRGFYLRASKVCKPPRAQFEKHYESLKGYSFFNDIIDFMCSDYVVLMIWSSPDIVKMSRAMLGTTDPVTAAAGTIRGDYCKKIRNNICHASDSIESAEREIKLWFFE